jgi:hypothetical protein
LQNLLRASFRLTGSARLAAFHYEILEILETGAADVREISDSLRQNGSWAIIYPTADGVFTESVSEYYFRLLEQLGSSPSVGEVAARLGISEAETAEFLEFALQEGIVQIC